MLQIFKKLGWLNDKTYNKLYLEAEEIGKMVSTLVKTL